MNARQTTRLRDDSEEEMVLRRRDINDEEYDPHWLIPGNQEIYDRDRNSEQSRRRHEEYCESTARNIARRYASRGAPGPRVHRPPGRITEPSRREWDTGSTSTPHPEEARRLTVMGFNLLVERARIMRLTQAPSVSPPPPMRSLTDWIDNIHGRGGDAVQRRRMADSPISHYNTWERVASHPTYDTQSGMFDGGGDSVLKTPPATSERLRKAYVIRVDKLKTINSELRDTRDKLKLDKDKLKLCAAATQSDDSVATE